MRRDRRPSRKAGNSSRFISTTASTDGDADCVAAVPVVARRVGVGSGKAEGKVIITKETAEESPKPNGLRRKPAAIGLGGRSALMTFPCIADGSPLRPPKQPRVIWGRRGRLRSWCDRTPTRCDASHPWCDRTRTRCEASPDKVRLVSTHSATGRHGFGTPVSRLGAPVSRQGAISLQWQGCARPRAASGRVHGAILSLRAGLDHRGAFRGRMRQRGGVQALRQTPHPMDTPHLVCSP